jgi:hypothetical protein
VFTNMATEIYIGVLVGGGGTWCLVYLSFNIYYNYIPLQAENVEIIVRKICMLEICTL